mgnify:FL=1
MMDEKKDIESVFSAVQGFSHALMDKMEIDPLIVAAVLAATSLSIYKTTLPLEDFEKIVDAIADSKDSVKSWNEMASGMEEVLEDVTVH